MDLFWAIARGVPRHTYHKYEKVGGGRKPKQGGTTPLRPGKEWLQPSWNKSGPAFRWYTGDTSQKGWILFARRLGKDKLLEFAKQSGIETTKRGKTKELPRTIE